MDAKDLFTVFAQDLQMLKWDYFWYHFSEEYLHSTSDSKKSDKVLFSYKKKTFILLPRISTGYKKEESCDQLFKVHESKDVFC